MDLVDAIVFLVWGVITLLIFTAKREGNYFVWRFYLLPRFAREWLSRKFKDAA